MKVLGAGVGGCRTPEPSKTLQRLIHPSELLQRLYTLIGSSCRRLPSLTTFKNLLGLRSILNPKQPESQLFPTGT